MLTAQNIMLVTKEIQKQVLKTVCEFPSLSIEELSHALKEREKNISQEEILQVLTGISPEKNWSKISRSEMGREILNYLWSFETQVLYLLPAKQKETTIAEFNQLRLRNKQPKVSKDLIRHIQLLLLVEGKNLSKFRRYEKDLAVLDDVDANIQAVWSLRILLSTLDVSEVSSSRALSETLVKKFEENFSLLSERVGRTILRISEKFVEKYFPFSTAETDLKELVLNFQSIYRTYKKGLEAGMTVTSEFQGHSRLLQNAVDQLKQVQSTVSSSHEGGFLGKLLTGRLKNKEGIIHEINNVISLLDQLEGSGSNMTKSAEEKSLLVQKLQSDYENIVLLKSQLESDLYNLRENMDESKEKNKQLETELSDTTESLEKAHEKIASLQQKVDKIPDLDQKTDILREELNTAKDIALRLYRRVNKLKDDLILIRSKQKNHSAALN